MTDCSAFVSNSPICIEKASQVISEIVPVFFPPDKSKPKSECCIGFEDKIYRSDTQTTNDYW